MNLLTVLDFTAGTLVKPELRGQSKKGRHFQGDQPSSSLPSRFKCQPFERKELKDPPFSIQRLDDIDLLARLELTVKFLCAESRSPCFKHHPPQRWPIEVHGLILHVPTSAKYSRISISGSQAVATYSHI